MKNYKIYYKPMTGLSQTTPLEAYCYLFEDGFFHFFLTEDCLSKNAPFKSLNKDGIWSINEIFQDKV